MSRRQRILRMGSILGLSGIFATLPPAPAGAQVPKGEFAERRADLAVQIEEGLIVGMGSAQPPEDYINFYQNSPFRYLTGFLEPNATLVSLVTDRAVTKELIFVNPRNPAEETWEGYRIGPSGTQEVVGIQGRSVGELQPVFDSLVAQGWKTVYVIGSYDPSSDLLNDVTQRVATLVRGHPSVEVQSLSAEVNELRGVKTEAELELIRRATTITSQAQREFMGVAAPGVNEFEIQAVVEHTFRRYGAERPAFASIVGSGSNSTVLHYNANDRFMQDGDVVVVDIGASYGGYAADITRTVPVNGRFNTEQGEIYQLVRDAQSAAEEIARPGVSAREMAQIATEVLADGLANLGLIESQWATYEDENGSEIPQYFLYYMHGLSHGLGLDVHDPWPSVMEPGVAFTIEPGIYVRPNLFDEVVPDTPGNRRMRDALMPAFERYVDIGVRIEDDFVITADGVERISTAPREIEEIEALMLQDWRGPEGRNAEWVDWYRRMP